MEPMTLGSAPSSPSSPGVNNFLPNFLMGDSTQSQPGTPNLNTSPGRTRTPILLRKPTQTSTPDPRNLYQKLYNSNQNNDNTMQTKQFTPHKAGPPNQGLFDAIEPKRNKPDPSPINSTALPFTDSPSFSKNLSRINDDSLNYTRNLNSLNETTAFNRTNQFNRTDRIDTYWVTVFGFPPSALSFVLAQLLNCGVIVDKKLPPQGNWVHVKFENLNDVSRALALNGRCINNSIMIGVNLFYNNEIKENDSVVAPIRARSLRQSFVSPNESNSVLPPQNLPQKSTGLVSKAFEYVFGW